MTTTYNLKDGYTSWKAGADPEVDEWFLMGNPSVIIGILLAYLVFVLGIGPKYMKNRPPMELKNLMIAYNGFQVLLSAWLVYKSIVGFLVTSTFSNSCTYTKRHYLINVGAWWYTASKLTEFMDTVFFVLRKKHSQISFLHVYHHSITFVGSWLFLKYTNGEQGVIIGVVNSAVHVIMYFYYMVAAMGPKYQKYIWWKKYMTMIQLVQFGIIIAFITYLSVSSCAHSRIVTYCFIINTFVFVYLFADFYRKSYRSKKLPVDVNTANGTNNIQNENGVVGKSYIHTESYSQLSKESLRKRE